MRRVIACGVVLVLASGCNLLPQKRSSLLLERYAHGQLAEAHLAGGRVNWTLAPVTQTQQQQGVEVTVTHATTAYLKQLFSDPKIFGEFAGQDPYFPENLIFYIKIANNSQKKLRIFPGDFVIVDDRGNQYSPLNVDYVTAYAEYKAPVSTFTRGILEDARPGYFGLSLPVGKIVAQKPQGRFALIQQSSIQSGVLHPGVVHDGLVAFWNPNRLAKKVRLLITNIKTDYNSEELPQASLDFPFEFTVSGPQ